MVFYKTGQIAGLIERIQPAWKHGPEQVRLSTGLPHVFSVYWWDYVVEEMIIVCPD